MKTDKSNHSVESLINKSTSEANAKIEQNDNLFYVSLTSFVLVGLITLLVIALN